MSHQWNHVVFSDWLLSLSVFSKFFHVEVLWLYDIYIFLLLNTITCYGYSPFCLSIHQLMNIWVFLLLATMNNEAMNIHIHEHMGIYLFNVYQGVELLERMVTPGFPGGSNGKESACNKGDLGSIPGSGRYPEEGICYPFQYSCLEHSMDRGAWQATYSSWGFKE